MCWLLSQTKLRVDGLAFRFRVLWLRCRVGGLDRHVADKLDLPDKSLFKITTRAPARSTGRRTGACQNVGSLLYACAPQTTDDASCIFLIPKKPSI